MTEASEPKERFHSYASAAVQRRSRATVRGVAKATDTDYTLAQFTEEALEAYCERLEREYHDGQRWPVDGTRLRPGARIR